jgi:hypothetical protein
MKTLNFFLLPGRMAHGLSFHDDGGELLEAALDPRCVVGLFAESFQLRPKLQVLELKIPDLGSLFDVHLLQLDDRPLPSIEIAAIGPRQNEERIICSLVLIGCWLQ